MPEGAVSWYTLAECNGTCHTSANMLLAGAGRPSVDRSHGALERASSVFEVDEEEEEEEEPHQEESAPALPAPVLTPEGARQLSALMDGVVHDFMGMVSRSHLGYALVEHCGCEGVHKVHRHPCAG